MRLLPALCWSLVTYLSCQGKTSPKPTSKIKHDGTEESESTEEVYIPSNESLYTTAEMKDMVLKEMAGKTEEVQAYFDQFPSEEFKENSEDLKLKRYYEKKAIMEADSNQIYNITPGPFREPPASMYTIEVNDSYVPKYRMTTSEEKRLEREDTFHPEKTEEAKEVSKSTSESEDESSSSASDEPSDNKRKKKWPPNMDPKKKKKAKKDAKLAKRKNLVKNEINEMHLQERNIIHKKRNINEGKTENKEISQNPYRGKYYQNRNANLQFNRNERRLQDKQKNKSIYNRFLESDPHHTCQERKTQQTRHRSRLSQPGLQGIRPFL